MTDIIKNDLELIVGGILKEFETVRSIYLFGSVASGSFTDNSDYDVLIIEKDQLRKDETDAVTRVVLSLLGKISRPMDIVALGEDDLEFPSVFIYNVYHNRKILHGPDILIKYGKIADSMKPVIIDGVTVGYNV